MYQHAPEIIRVFIFVLFLFLLGSFGLITNVVLSGLSVIPNIILIHSNFSNYHLYLEIEPLHTILQADCQKLFQENYISIRKTCPCKVYPLKPHFYIVKLGYAGVYLFFLFLLKNIDCGYSLEPPRRGGSNVYPQSMF